MNKLELLEKFDKEHNGTYTIDDLAELIVEAYMIGEESIYLPIYKMAKKAFNDGMGVDMNNPKFANRMLASQILLFLDGDK